MKKIKLTQGKFALVDNKDYKYLNQFKWCAYKCGCKTKIYYASRTIRIKKDGKSIKKNISMHRLIMNPPNSMVIDHKDRNGLNNTRRNLRICTQRENSANRADKRRYTGIYKKGNKWVARITVFIGGFDTEKRALRAYKKYIKDNTD